MNIDTFTTAALADELRLTVMGGRVQNIVQITPNAFGLEIYGQGKRNYLHLNADPQAPRIYLASQKPRRGRGNETPLMQLFRKYLKSSILRVVEQPNLERVLLLHFSSRIGETSLIIELLGTRSNMIFTDADRRILSLARPVPSQPNRHRVLLPNHPYTLPHPQNKLTVETLTLEVTQSMLKRAPAQNLLSKTLVTRLAGLSPLIAREIVYRACGDVETRIEGVGDAQALLQAIQRVYEPLVTRQWKPYVAFDKQENVEYFAPVALTHLPHAEPAVSISQAVEAHFAHQLSGTKDSYHAARYPVHLAITRAKKQVERRLKNLDQDAAKLEDPETYKQHGEMILAYSYQIEPGQQTFEVPYPDDPSQPMIIRLDPALSASENAQQYFARYQKAKRAGQIIPAQQSAARLALEYLEQLALDLEMAESRPDIEAVIAALAKEGYKTNVKKQEKKKPQKKTMPAISQPRRFVSPDGFVVWVGRNAEQNHRLTFGQAKPNDIWLHARGVPGSHVVISAPDSRPPRSTIEWAAGLAAFYSKAKKAGRAIVSYTRKKYVRPIKGAPPGLVRLSNESTVRVAPTKPAE